MNFRDVELLSAYLDGQLASAEVARLDARLAVDEPLRRVLDDLRVSRGLLRRVPQRKAPRNFTLNPLSARVRAPQPRAVPVLRYAGAVASLLFVFTLGLNTLVPMAARSLAAAPAPAYGMGGGAGDEQLQTEMYSAEPAATPGAAPAAPAAPFVAAPTLDARAKAAPTESPAGLDTQRQAATPVAPLWIMLLGVLSVVSITLAWYLDRITRRRFRSRVMDK